MAIATPAVRESLASYYAGLATHASLHTADPGTTGGNEVTGGSPAYARVALTWSAGSQDGIYTATLASAFDVPAATDITHVGLWNAPSGGTFRDAVAFSASFASQGTLTFDSLSYTQS